MRITKLPSTQEEAQKIFMNAFNTYSDHDEVYKVLLGMKDLLDKPFNL